MTDASVLALAASDEVSGYAEATSWRASDLDPAAVAREAAEKAERTRGATTIEPQTFRAVLEPYAISGSSSTSPSPRSTHWLSSKDAAISPEGSARSSSTRASRSGTRASTAQLPEGFRPRGRSQAARADGRGRRRARRRLGSPNRQAGRRRGGFHGTRARASDQAFGPVVQPLNGRRRRGLCGRARRARRRGHLRTRLHYLGVVDPGRNHHRNDARRHVSHRRREGDDTRRQPSFRPRSRPSSPVSSA